MAKLRHTRPVEAAGIDEWNDADRIGDFDARFQAQLETGFTADRVVIDVERSGFLVRVCTDRPTAAGINALVSGKFGK